MEYYDFKRAMDRKDIDANQLGHLIDSSRGEQGRIREKMIELNKELAKQEGYEIKLRNKMFEQSTGCSMAGLDKLTVKGQS